MTTTRAPGARIGRFPAILGFLIGVQVAAVIVLIWIAAVLGLAALAGIDVIRQAI